MDYGKIWEVVQNPEGDWGLKNDHCNYESAAEVIWYEKLKFCGCGDPEGTMHFIAKMLELQKAGTYVQFQELVKDNLGTVDVLLRYLLDAFELTEHGSSVFGAWLTERGKQVQELFTDTELVDR